MRERIQLIVALAVCIGAGYALLAREGSDTQSILEGGQGGREVQGGGDGPEVPAARGLDSEAAGAITDVVALVVSNQEPCDYYTEPALEAYSRPGGPLDAYDACLEAEDGERRIEPAEVKVVSIAGKGRRATARWEAAGRSGTARFVDVGGEWLLSRPVR